MDTRHWNMQVGQRGEQIAERYLTDLGWDVLDRNWRTRVPVRGELDLVAAQPRADGPPCLVVVEVKTRTTLAAGPPAAAVCRRKIERLGRLAHAWVATHATSCRGLRVDVVSVLLPGSGPAQVRHHRGAEAGL